MSIKPDIILISSVKPLPTSAGEVVLHRHLSQMEGWNVSVVEDSDIATENSLLSKLRNRLQNTRFHIWLKDLEVVLKGRRWNRFLKCSSLSKRNSIVLTVAHGDGCWAARRFSRKHGLPLVTIFHDWLPDSLTIHGPVKQMVERRFRQLYHSSAAALCVSDEMKSQLGDHPNSLVLYPIPSSVKSKSEQREKPVGSESKMLVAYSGGLYDYGPMLAGLLDTAKDNPVIKLQVRGKKPNWPIAFQSEMRERNLWLDFAPREDLEQWFHSADILLVTMSFDLSLRRRMQTSFPSKLIEYSQFGKPILVWGPSYCSAVAWAREDDKALCVVDQNPISVVSELERFRLSNQMQDHYATQSQKAAAKEFNPAVIQKMLLDELSNVLKPSKQSCSDSKKNL